MCQTMDGKSVVTRQEEEDIKILKRTLMEWEPINERLIKARFNSKYCNFTIIQYYAPTNDSEDDMKEEWYDQ